MTLDYEQLGFVCGLEIHQQLEGKKLFCSCPTTIRKDDSHFVLKRKLRVSSGESGGIDQAALHELSKGKEFWYQGYDDTTCLVEIDEEPPHEVNQEALLACLNMCLLLHAKIPKHSQFMRKIVIDGSNVSGFQRTALVGRDGHITLQSGKRIGIATVCLEEEACQAIERKKDHDVYNLSRLGIPLIEIATEPEFNTPEEVKEGAAIIGMLLRSIDGMKRGIGSIRQDVNVSIKGGARVEIKGFQEYKSIPKVIDKEIERQLSIIKTGRKPSQEVRGANTDFSTEFLRPMPGRDRMYPETDIPITNIDTSMIYVGKTLDEQKSELVNKFSIAQPLAEEILRKKIPFEQMVEKYPALTPAFIAETIITTPKEIKARYKAEINILEAAPAVFEKLHAKIIPQAAVFEILVEIALGRKPDYNKYQGLSDHALEEIIKRIAEKHKTISMQALMGIVMAEMRGKAEGKKVAEIVKKYAL